MNKKKISIIVGSLILIIAISVVVFLFIRKENRVINSADLFSMMIGQEKDIPNGPLLRFTGVIEDSRCPSDVECVQAGRALIKVSLSPYENEIGKYMDKLQQLSIPGGNSDYYYKNCISSANCSNVVIIPGMNTALVFVKLEPYPVSTNEADKSLYKAYFSLKQLKAESETFTLPTEGRPDEVAPGPIKQECQARLDEYMKGGQFKDKGLFMCELLESKASKIVKDCPDGLSPQGCSICKIKCR